MDIIEVPCKIELNITEYLRFLVVSFQKLTAGDKVGFGRPVSPLEGFGWPFPGEYLTLL